MRRVLLAISVSLGALLSGCSGSHQINIGMSNVASSDVRPNIVPDSIGYLTQEATMPTAREGLASGVVNNLLYAIGGWNKNTKSQVEAYNPPTNTWRTKAPLLTPQGYLAAGVANNIPSAVGGDYRGQLNTVEAYSP